jgi:tetratricopeptide (TPR) repeat protein
MKQYPKRLNSAVFTMKKNLLLPFSLSVLSLLMPFHASVSAASPLPTVLAQSLEDRKAQADQLLAQGIEQLDANQLDAALQSFQQALAIQRQIGDSSNSDRVSSQFGEAVALNNLGIAYYYKGEHEQAIASYQESMKIFWSLYDRSGIAASLNNQSIVSLELGDYQKAIEFCHGAIGIFRNMGDRTREAATLNNMGLAYEKLEEYQRAIGYLQEALTTAQDNGDVRGEVITLNNLREAYSKLGQSDKAKELEQQALAISQEVEAQVDTEEAVTSNDFLLIRQNKRSLAIVFSNQQAK